MMYLTYLERPEQSDNYNRYDGYNNPVILHKDWDFHLGRFPSMEKAKEFLDFAGIQIGKLICEDDCGEKGGMYRQWAVTPNELEDHKFTTLRDIPEGAKPFTGLSNGSLVTCYLYNDGKKLNIYRPNPNMKGIYKPLSVEDHIAFCRKNGYV